MKRGGLGFLSIILGLAIILLGASAGVLAFTNSVPKISQTDNNQDSEEEDEEDINYPEASIASVVDETEELDEDFKQFSVNNNQLLSSKVDDNENEKEDGKDSVDSEDNEEDSSENSEETDGTEEDSETDDYKFQEPKEVKKEVNKSKKSGDGYLFANSANKKLNRSSALDLIEKVDGKGYKMPGDRSAARMIINEMYAKHGAKFKDNEVQKYFNKKSWYKKIKKKISTDKAFSKMSSLEKKNIEILDEIDKEN